MLTKRLVIFIIAIFSVVLITGIIAVAIERPFSKDGALPHIAGGVTLVCDPAEVKLESENRIHLKLHATNSGSGPVLSWALDLGKGLYLVKAEPREILYHKGHAKAAHGNVLVYAIPIESGASLPLELTLRVLFDTEGNFNSEPELRLFYARSTKDAQTLAAKDLQTFRDTFIAFPFVAANIHIER